MRRGITFKLIVTIVLILCLSFAATSAIILKVAAGNSDKLTQGILSQLERHQGESLKALKAGFSSTDAGIRKANEEIQQTVLNLYEMKYGILLSAIANRIFPLVENFDYEGAAGAVKESIKLDKRIEGFELITSEKPAKSDIFNFGNMVEGGERKVKALSLVTSTKAAYIKVIMYVSMLDAQESLSGVGNIFETIGSENNKLADTIEKDSLTAIAQAREIALATAQKERRELQLNILALMGAVLAISCLLILAFTRREVIKPINRMVTDLTESSEQVSAVSVQVASTSMNLADGTAQQAQALEEMSSVLEAMSSKSKRNAECAKDANGLMADTSEIVQKATSSMTALTGTMQEISAASEDTRKIVRSIDEIAFQTNLLALNAAVEAARAGEAGAGFAVVADEVRNLAMRAAEAARTTADLIDGTVGKIKEGVDVVGTTNGAFIEVAGGLSSVAGMMEDIATAALEQVHDTDQINRAMAEMEKVVHRNTADAEESAAVSEEMNVQATRMKGVVNDLRSFVGGRVEEANAPPDMNRITLRAGDEIQIMNTPARLCGLSENKANGNKRIVSAEEIIPLNEAELDDF